jgi:phosphoglycerol transferase MdoB-like AlkP superfamily enzyme
MRPKNNSQNQILNIFIFFGTVLPYLLLVLFFTRHGFNFPLLLTQVVGTPGAAFFAADVILSALFVIYLAATNTTMGNRRYWVIAASLLVGPSCALPLYFRLK